MVIPLRMLLTLHMNKANCNKKKRPQMFVLYSENNVLITLQLLYHLTLLTHTFGFS